MKPLLTLVASLAAGLASAQEAPRVPVDDVRVLLIAAIDSPEGDPRGQLTGEMARMITDHFRASGPILIDVTTLKRYTQAGCSRLNVRFSQQGVQLPGTVTPQAKSVDIGINYCRDGQPPRSTS